MDKIFVTTFNKRLYDEYAHQLLKTFEITNQKIPLYVFVEDDIKQYPKFENVHFLDLFEHEPDLKKFIDRNKNIKVESFFKDAVRFSYKVFAQNAARKYGDKIFFIDADCVFDKPIPIDWFDEFLPDDTFVSFYDRPQQYTETGFLAFNENKLISKAFFNYYLNLYKEDKVFELDNWTDCHTFDYTRRYFKEDIHYKELSKGDGRNGHIMARDKILNQYIDHRKGKRKQDEHSPEWRKNR